MVRPNVAGIHLESEPNVPPLWKARVPKLAARKRVLCALLHDCQYPDGSPRSAFQFHRGNND